ncbi:hypothetical protein C0J29_30645 (plasmid) [Mycobacterium paragordonae]|uniref:Uncharacterized protein n=1 Tax=Mycobacterium paragordonae TaxID=1389713 RepID=A0ABQ1CF82_9MYCO|nr:MULTISPECIES: hypothetical protein [Mycobacterium]AYE99332.1 hypothetical protein C0J29_30645 [Mycobacterium paragordonae]GFG82910.1 hypothetical protein MPRG_61860 [Mycobacterium paragordonae]
MNTTEHTIDPWTSTDHDPHQPPAVGSDADAENIYADWDLEIEHHRTQLVNSLNTALSALTGAHTAVSALLSDQVYDVEFTEATTGEDVAAFITESLRLSRAAYALTQHITDRS